MHIIHHLRLEISIRNVSLILLHTKTKINSSLSIQYGELKKIQQKVYLFASYNYGIFYLSF